MLASVIQPAYRHVAKHLAASFFQKLAAERGNGSFSVKLWDGTDLALAPKPQFTLVIREPRVLKCLFQSPSEETLGESYIRGDFEIEGDFEAALRFVDKLLSYAPTKPQETELRMLAAALPANSTRVPGLNDALKGDLHSRERDRAAIACHYDVSNEFYRLWLDQSMMYSCAYFQTTDDDIDTAQLRKLDYICQKLGLRPGDKLLDIGCGWGGLVMHAASHYGAYACGITLSMRQAELAQQRIRAAGLTNCCAVRLCDYRDVEGPGEYDKIASIGMVEHVGKSMLATYFAQAWELLRPGGAFFVSGIGASATYRKRGPSFIGRYVFPDGDLVPLHTTVYEAETAGFEVRDVENLREHYALTLDRWVERLEKHADEARQATDAVTYRIWKLYMAGSAHGFRTGRVNLYHLLLSKRGPGESRPPLTPRNRYEEINSLPGESLPT